MSDLPYVAIDLRGLQPGFKSHQGRGIGRYVRSLVAAMLPLDPDAHLAFVIEGAGDVRPFGRGLDGRTCRIEAPDWTDRFGGQSVHVRQHLTLPRALRPLPFDLFHFCSQTDAPATMSVPYVVTVLDLIPHRLPDLYVQGKSRARFRLGRWLERRALRRARGLIAISEHTRRDLVSLLRIPEERIAVTPLGIDAHLAPAPEAAIAALCRRHQLSPGYLLYVGGIDRRKNVPFLLEVMRLLLEKRPETELVLAGNYRDDPDYPELIGRIQRSGLERAIRLLGFVAEDELAALYSAAAVFVFPSLYEGFGLPPLEAMACGSPVVAADRTSLGEVLSPAAVLADPTDAGGFARAVLSVIDVPSRRRELSEAGRRRAADFTWETTARATLEAYRRFAAIG
ncbi:MAG: hypothetical protein QOD06_1891 [Candidatus Binatota bacterium]|jgi:glycosyltransferase involved in cell wall biosynthesis|nr:hypothetical protein [Candidatus Binatota bacterium]